MPSGRLLGERRDRRTLPVIQGLASAGLPDGVALQESGRSDRKGLAENAQGDDDQVRHAADSRETPLHVRSCTTWRSRARLLPLRLFDERVPILLQLGMRLLLEV